MCLEGSADDCYIVQLTDTICPRKHQPYWPVAYSVPSMEAASELPALISRSGLHMVPMDSTYTAHAHDHGTWALSCSTDPSREVHCTPKTAEKVTRPPEAAPKLGRKVCTCTCSKAQPSHGCSHIDGGCFAVQGEQSQVQACLAQQLGLLPGACTARILVCMQLRLSSCVAPSARAKLHRTQPVDYSLVSCGSFCGCAHIHAHLPCTCFCTGCSCAPMPARQERPGLCTL